MDPSTMDFMMHAPEHASPPSSTADHAARSTCPALRAVTEHNQHPPPSFPSRPNYYFDPVHNNPHFWQALPPPHSRWPSEAPFQPTPPIVPLGTGQINQPPYPSNLPNPYNSHQPPPFRYGAPMLSLQRIGGTAPIQHSQGSFSGSTQGQGQPQSQPGISGESGSGSGSGGGAHGQRANNLPSLNTVPPATSNQGAQATFAQTSHPTQRSTQHSPPSFIRHSMPSALNMADVNLSPLSGRAEAGTSHSASSSPPRRAPTGPRATTEVSSEANTSEPRRASASAARSRRGASRLPSSESGWSSDDDSDPDAVALSFLEAAVSGTPGEHASDDRLRAHQLMRGAVSSKRVASKKAITSLESVTISSLPENERTCVICYNDYGVQTPEGINETPLRLPKCKHVFGDHCIKKWFEESDSCPYCRDKVPSEPQYRHAMNPHNVYRYLRQHHQMHMQMQMRARDHERGDSDPPSRPTEATMGGFATLASSPFPDLDYGMLGGGAARRAENMPMYGSRTAAWYGSFGDRHSPLPFNEVSENRRRVRPRHGSLRGFPPGRPHFAAPPVNTTAQPQQYPPWVGRPNTSHMHNRQHSASSNTAARPTFDANVSGFPFQPQVGSPSEPYPNPLNMTNSAGAADEYPTLPHMRSQHVSPLSPTYAGPEVYMSNADDPGYSGSVSHQQS